MDDLLEFVFVVVEMAVHVFRNTMETIANDNKVVVVVVVMVVRIRFLHVEDTFLDLVEVQAMVFVRSRILHAENNVFDQAVR